ncbi:MAG: amidohydrolase family protein [Acidimicrobiales bacterium]
MPRYIVHLSAAEALEQVVIARDRGKNVSPRRPQYLYLTLEEHLDQPGIDGLRHICSPPLRTKGTGDSLWQGLRTDDLSVVSTDHCPFCDSEKLLGIDDFRDTPNGLGSIEHRMDLLHQGVVTGEISLSRWVDVCSTTPARLFGLQGKKGTISPGADADIVIYDHRHPDTVRRRKSHGCGQLGLAGHRRARPGGVCDESRHVCDPQPTLRWPAGHGRYLTRQISDVLR